MGAQEIVSDMRRWIECADEVQEKWRREGRDISMTHIAYESIARVTLQRFDAMTDGK